MHQIQKEIPPGWRPCRQTAGTRAADRLLLVRSLEGRPSLISPHESCPAVDQQRCARDVRAVVAGQEQEASGDLLRTAHAAERNELVDELRELPILIVDVLG